LTQHEKDNSLLMTLAIVNASRGAAVEQPQSLPEKTVSAFRRAVTFLQACDLASHAKVGAVLSAIDANNRYAPANRGLCVHRDRMLIYAHNAHDRAVHFRGVNPVFTVNDSARLYARVSVDNRALAGAFAPPIQIAAMEEVLEQPDDDTFGRIMPLKSQVGGAPPDVTLIWDEFASMSARSGLSLAAQAQFDRLVAGINGNVMRSINRRTYVTGTPFTR